MGLDFGTKRIGVAICEQAAWAARGIATIYRKGGEKDVTAISQLVLQHEVDSIVVGFPLNMDGSQGRLARLAQEFAQTLRERLNLPVTLVDERLSSWEAEGLLMQGQQSAKKRKDLVDQVAAALILERYLAAKE